MNVSVILENCKYHLFTENICIVKWIQRYDSSERNGLEVELNLYVPGWTAADRLSTAELFSRLFNRRCTKYRFNHSEFIL